MEDEPQLFLIDTGSAYSFLKSKYKDRVTDRADKEFLAVNASPITIYGMVDLKLELGSFNFHQKFHVAEVENNIIGNDFLVSNKILINVGEKILAWQNQETHRIESFSINGIIPRKNYHRLPIIFKKNKATNTKMVKITNTNKNREIKRELLSPLPRRDNIGTKENNEVQKDYQEIILVKNNLNFKEGKSLSEFFFKNCRNELILNSYLRSREEHHILKNIPKNIQRCAHSRQNWFPIWHQGAQRA